MHLSWSLLHFLVFILVLGSLFVILSFWFLLILSFCNTLFPSLFPRNRASVRARFYLIIGGELGFHFCFIPVFIEFEARHHLASYRSLSMPAINNNLCSLLSLFLVFSFNSILLFSTFLFYFSFNLEFLIIINFLFSTNIWSSCFCSFLEFLVFVLFWKYLVFETLLTY